MASLNCLTKALYFRGRLLGEAEGVDAFDGDSVALGWV